MTNDYKEVTGNQKKHSRSCVDALLGLLLPPVLVYMRRGMVKEFWVCILLWILGLLPGILYAFWLDGIECVHDI